MRKWVSRVAFFLVLILCLGGAAVWLLEFYPRHGSHPSLRLAKGTIAIQHARIYVSPTDPPVEDGTVLVQDGRIAAVGAQVALAPGVRIVACDHCVVAAGFWNTHVHFTEPKWSMAQWKSAATLNPQLANMFLSRGFTTVIDLGSNPADTFAIRRRIEKGELAGPYIYTAGTALYPPHGVPFYLRETMPGWMVRLMPQPDTPEEAQRIVRRNLNSGADVTKLFTGSWIERGRVLPMPLNIARAAVTTSHLNGRIVFAHPSNLPGTEVAIKSGVDVLAHVPDDTRGITPQLFSTMVGQNMGMIPTLKMFTTTVTSDPRYMDPMYEEVRTFHALGGTLLFGTDVGYMTDYSTQGEFEALDKSGLGWRDVLAMLTTNPAARMGVQDQKGTVSAGKLADLVVLDADPAADLKNFSRVQTVIRSGAVVWQR
ncbi:MAG TPA: amidohydrolase family protein [Terracidiphilus sp.]|jgi:imidazolonepropionase-like amidohydrolase